MNALHEHHRSHPLGRRGFTLVELLVAIAIIALLASIMMPSIRNAGQAASMATCISRLRQLSTGHRTHAAANRGAYCRARDYLTTESPEQGSVRGISSWPTIESIPERSILVEGGYLSGGVEVFLCPNDDGTRNADGAGVVNAIRPASFSYTRNGSVNGIGPSVVPSLASIERPGDTALLVEEWEYAPFNDSYLIANSWDLMTQRHNGRGGMAFFDDHVSAIDTQTFNLQSPLWRLETYLDP